MELALALTLGYGLATGIELDAIKGEMGRFPPQVIVDQYRDMARGHVKWLEGLRVTYPDLNPGIDNLIKDQERVLKAYEVLTDARRDFYYVTFRRRSLDELKSMIDPLDYYYGKLPMPLPCMECP